MEVMILRNINSRVPDPNEFVSCAGNRLHQLYTSKVQEDGSVVLIEAGVEDTQELIDSYVDQTDIAYIISHLQAGDTSVLSSKTPMYGDFTDAPKDMRHAMQIMIDGEKAFYDLPVDVRQKFDNDFRKFIVQAGSDEWYSKIDGITGAESAEVEGDEVIEQKS